MKPINNDFRRDLILAGTNFDATHGHRVQIAKAIVCRGSLVPDRWRRRQQDARPLAPRRRSQLHARERIIEPATPSVRENHYRRSQRSPVDGRVGQHDCRGPREAVAANSLSSSPSLPKQALGRG